VSIRKKLTLEGRLNVAETQAQSALGVFEVAAQRLDAAAEALTEVGDAAEVERMRAQQVRDEADKKRVAYVAKASKIRELFQ
jgi:hypothetical protein